MPLDPGTGLTILGGAIGSAKLVEKVLGPTAEYLGGGLREWTERRFENIKNIFEHADKLLGDDANPEHRVPPRVLRDILNDGSFRDDELSAAYYGAILASSRTGVSRDDRGASFTSLVGRLTAYQLRAHYVLYRCVTNLFTGESHNLQDSTGRTACGVYIPFQDYLNAMGLEAGEDPNTLITHAIFGLQTESLIEDQFAFGGQEVLKRFYGACPDNANGLAFQPSVLGVELFLWSTGNPTSSINSVLSGKLKTPDLDVKPCPNACRTKPAASGT